ncbi:MAG: NAD(P)H-binding protein [Gemmatimonadaceae bacterium]
MKTGAIPPVVLTGATGFVGRRVLHELSRRGATTVRALARNTAALTESPDWHPEWRAVACDLSREEIPAGVVTPGCVVLHLAAATGKASPSEMRAVNVEGTRRVVSAASAGEAAHLVFVSSIAASFRDQRWYHYAHAKREGEALLTGSGLPCSIVRPAMIFGEGSPIQSALAGLAAGGAPIVLGSGQVQVQPIHVDDLATFLVALAGAQPLGAKPVEVGGGERLTMRDLLARLRDARGLAPRTPVSVPLGALRVILGAVEPLAGAVLPVTAGQLASFVNDSSAAPDPRVSPLLPAPRGVAEMLAGAAPVSASPARTASIAVSVAENDHAGSREFAVFAAYLGTSAVDARLTEAWARAHRSLSTTATDRLDAWLYTWGRAGTFRCALADCYARRVRPFGVLRRKLVLALAVLETMPSTHADYDTATHSSTAAAWLSLVAAGVRWGALTLLAIVTLLPVHLALALGGAPRATHHG